MALMALCIHGLFLVSAMPKLKPSEKCIAAGLESLAELSRLTGVSDNTLINWSRSKPKLFQVVIAGVVALKKESAE